MQRYTLAFGAAKRVFARSNGIPQLAEVHFAEKMAFRSWRKLIYTCKWLGGCDERSSFTVLVDLRTCRQVAMLG
jgi:hypothetical protein